MSANAAPVTVHAGIFVQSRLPVVLHRVIPTGTLSLHNIGMVEAALIGMLIYSMTIPQNGASMSMMEYAIGGGIGAGLYHVAPP